MRHKIKSIAFVLFITVSMLYMIGCSSSIPASDVSAVKIDDNRKQLIVNYDTSRVMDVRIGGIKVESGVPYYLKPGSYFVTYRNKAVISGSFEYSKNGRAGARGGASNMSEEEAEHVDLYQDTTIDIKGHKYEINVSGGKNI